MRILARTATAAVRRFSAMAIADRVLWISLVLGLSLSLVVCFRIATESLVLGSNAGGWIYRFVQPFSVRILVIVALVATLSGTALVALGRPIGTNEWGPVLGWLLLAFCVQGLMRTLTPFTFEQMFASSGANSFYTVTQQYRLSAVLGDFVRLRQSWPIHAQSNMPGKLALVYALEFVSNRPGMLAWLVVAVSNLGGLFLYLFVRDLFADRQTALFALVLYVFVPGKLFFFPLLNTATPTIVLACAWLCMRWLTTGRATYAAGLGAALFGLVFFEPLPLVLGLLFAALVFRAVSRGERSWRELLPQTGTLLLAFGAMYALLFLFFGFDLLRVFRGIALDAVVFNEGAERPYTIWLEQNVTDFLFGMGVCQAVLCAAALGVGFGRSKKRGSVLDEPILVCGLALTSVLVTLDVFGVNRGEVIRLWIFLACLFQIPTAYVCARLNSRLALMFVVATTVLQDALGTAMIGFVLP